VVHGIPSDYALKEGDIISVDCGVILNGWYGDSAYTFAVGEIDDEVRRLLEYTRASLEEGVKEAVSGNRVGDISLLSRPKRRAEDSRW
jgi:methionyl aminopeptidase